MKKVFVSVLISILGLPTFAFFDGKISKDRFYDKINTIMSEEIFDKNVKTQEYWTENVLHLNKYRPVFMLSNKELYNLEPKKSVKISQGIVVPSVYNISLKNSSIINVSFNSNKQLNKKVQQQSTTLRNDNSAFSEIYEKAKKSDCEIEDKIQAAISLKNSKKTINYNLAIDLLDDVTRKESFNAYAYYLKGELYAMKNDSENAMKNYIESLKINPTNKQCFKSIAKVLQPTNRELASKYYNKALQ